MEFQDYYKTLGVARTATADGIKKAFHKAARTYHPDINASADAEEKFKAVNEAYEVLKDPEKRAAYDQLSQQPPRGNARYEPPPGWDAGYSFTSSDPRGDPEFSDFFETLFRRGAGQPQGMDSHAKIQIEIEDAFEGAHRTLAFRAPVVGPDGQVHLQNRTMTVGIPKGVTQGQHLRVPSVDESGDLFLEISFAPHPIYRPEGRDLYVDLPLAPWEAALGGKVKMPTPGGKVNLTIPKNARSGQVLRLKGKGLPAAPSGGVAGDILATLKIVNPDASTAHARAFFEQMAKDMPFDPRAHLKG